MTPWYLRTWPDADDERPSRPDDEAAEYELADEESDRVERDATRHW